MEESGCSMLFRPPSTPVATTKYRHEGSEAKYIACCLAINYYILNYIALVGCLGGTKILSGVPIWYFKFLLKILINIR